MPLSGGWNSRARDGALPYDLFLREWRSAQHESPYCRNHRKNGTAVKDGIPAIEAIKQERRDISRQNRCDAFGCIENGIIRRGVPAAEVVSQRCGKQGEHLAIGEVGQDE